MEANEFDLLPFFIQKIIMEDNMGTAFLEQFLMISSIETVLFLVVLLLVFAGIRQLEKRKVSFSKRMIAGTALGFGLGVLVQISSGFAIQPMELKYMRELTTWYGLFGNGFMDLLKMLVVPLVLVAIVHVIINMEEKANISKLTRNTLILSITMVGIASVVGIVLGVIFQLGEVALSSQNSYEIRQVGSLAGTIESLLPSNITNAMLETNVIALVITAAFFGVGARRMKKKYYDTVKPFYDVVNAFYKIIMSVAMSIIKFMPYAVVPLLANTIASKGLDSMLDVVLFIGLLYLGLVLMFLIQLLALALFGLHPISYVKKAIPALVLAFTSRSSVGTLPLSVETLTSQLGVNSGTASFVAGLGTTAGMQGCAGVFPALLLVYVANVNQIPIDITFVFMTIVVVSLSSFGIAGIPGAATMSVSASISGMGFAAFFPSISPILAIDPILDMGRTCLNVSGAMVNAVIVDKTLGTLNVEEYHS